MQSHMENLDLSQFAIITFKFGGYWTHGKNLDRKKYDGWKQKTVKFKKDVLSVNVIKQEIETICPWMIGSEFQLLYRIRGSLTEEYQLISSDTEVMNMTEELDERSRIDVIVTTVDEEYSNNIVMMNTSQIIEQYHSSSNYVDDLYAVGGEEESKVLRVGARFNDSKSFKNALRSETIANNFGVKIVASNKSRVVATCSHRECSWRIRASLCVDDQSFEVRTLIATHSCPGINRSGNKQATSTWIAQEINDIVRKQPNIPPKQLNHNLENLYGLSLPYMKLWRAREQARDNIFGSVDENYQWVPTLRAELLKRNPGSHIVYECSGYNNSFKRFYVSFKVCIDGFLSGCRHLIGIDACHLKSKYLGVLLAANSLDGNNGLFTLSFAVAESESKVTWEWFLENLAVSLGYELHDLAFISDMEKGLGEAIKKFFPNAEHRVCLQHLWKNFKKCFRCDDNSTLRNIVWSAANVCTIQQFHAKMNQLFNICPQAHAYLLALPYKWSRSHFSVEIKNHYNTNNMSESFNSWIGEARSKPTVDLIDMIRGMLMEQRASRKSDAISWRSILVPQAESYIRNITTKKEQFIIRQSNPNKAEVEGLNERHVVDICCRECTCRFWQLSGLPCIHAVAFIGTKEHPLWHSYIDEHYYVLRYKMAYEGEISTLPGKGHWEMPMDGVQVTMPNTMRPRGRPRKRRIKDFLESNNRKFHKCGHCGLPGHHKSTCKNPLNQPNGV